TPSILFCYPDTPHTHIYSLSLHDALPISQIAGQRLAGSRSERNPTGTAPLAEHVDHVYVEIDVVEGEVGHLGQACADVEQHHLRSEEHTSELQSPYDLVCRLLLEKKKKRI